MSLKTFKPYTKTTRGTVLVDRSQLWKGKPYKSLTSLKRSSKGRNNYGRITSINRAGGHKKMYRNIDGKEDKQEFKGVPYSRHFTHTPLNQQNNIVDLIERNHGTNRIMLPNINNNSIFDRFFNVK